MPTSNRDLALAVDLGGTNLRAAAVSSGGELLAEIREPTDAGRGADDVIRRIAQAVQAVATQVGAPANVAVGVAAPGPLNPTTGIVHFTPNLPGWVDVPLRDRLAELLQRDVFLGNDANAAALGEFRFGAGRGTTDLIYVGLGTGIGGGVISAGQLIDGRNGLAAELGHLCVDLHGPRCTCGGAGCVEAFCGGWALTAEAEHLVHAGRGSAILKAADDRPIDPRAIGAAASAGDPDATALLNRAGRALGAGLAAYVNLFNPEIIAIGGGVAAIGDLLLAPARQAMIEYAMPIIAADVRIVRSQLGERTGTLGAAALVFHRG